MKAILLSLLDYKNLVLFLFKGGNEEIMQDEYASWKQTKVEMYGIGSQS